MKFTDTRLEGIVCLTGDGGDEGDLLRVISWKLNGNLKLLSFPQYPKKIPRGIPSPRTTLTGVLKVLLRYVDEFNRKLFLVIIDLEHFKGEEIINKIREEFTSLTNIDIIEILNSQCENALCIKGHSRKGKNFMALMSVMGIQGCPKIEYHIISVIKHKYGVEMGDCLRKEKKKEVKDWLRVRKVSSYAKLVEDLEIGEIESYFLIYFTL